MARLIEVRAVPEDARDDGDPFENGLTERQRASRLEGRKIRTMIIWGSEVHESLYRVDLFRQFLPRRGANGLGMVQFYGPRATRKFPVGSKKKPAWEVGLDHRCHTLTIGAEGFRIK